MDRLLDIVFGRTVRRGALTVINASGEARRYGDSSGPPVTVRFTSHAWQRRVIFDPELRLGEAYMEGGLVVESGSIAEFIDILCSNVGMGPLAFWAEWLRSARTAFRRLFNSNTLINASRNARHHYNVNLDVYRLFLDEDLQYSCAYFEHPDAPLDEAQQAKKRHIAAKLLLNRPNLSILDIGCGWGGLGLYLAKAARAHVVGVTLSDEQVKVARERAEAERASCEFRLQDYRDISGQFDRIVSIGMFEHVGTRYYELFFRKCRELLKDDGIFLLHTVGRLDGPNDTNPWVWRYIFPGGYTPALSELAPAIERSGLHLVRRRGPAAALRRDAEGVAGALLGAPGRRCENSRRALRAHVGVLLCRFRGILPAFRPGGVPDPVGQNAGCRAADARLHVSPAHRRCARAAARSVVRSHRVKRKTDRRRDSR